MPVEVAFKQPSVFMMRAYGMVTVDEVRLAVGEMLADPRLRDGVAIFIDNREVTSVRSVGEVALITTEFGRVFARGLMRVAALAPGGVWARSRMVIAVPLTGLPPRTSLPRTPHPPVAVPPLPPTP